jgi:Sugar-transfer associated ATP-grasp
MRASVAARAERLVYRIAGFPVALSAILASKTSADPLHSAFASRYWHPHGFDEWAELVGGLIAWPLALVIGALWFTWLNGSEVRRLHGKGVTTQVAEQMRLYFSAGVLAPWYYIFALYDADGRARAGAYLQRFETKPSIFPLLKRRRGSPLNDKARFAEYCAKQGMRCVETIFSLNGLKPQTSLPNRDLFVKPTSGRGGRGAERWDCIAPQTFVGPAGERLSADYLLTRLVDRSRREPLLVQPRLCAHPQLLEVTNGALPTVRIVTCLNEAGDPEVIGAVFRMAIGSNRTVDNLHAGGIAANVALGTGRLSRATDLGSDARLGWLSAHPDTGGIIENRVLPLWKETKQLAMSAHRAFTDRVVIGWDIAILPDGPIVIEGNGNPDMDILQRFMREGLREHRFGQLLAHHLRARVPELA